MIWLRRDLDYIVSIEAYADDLENRLTEAEKKLEKVKDWLIGIKKATDYFTDHKEQVLSIRRMTEQALQEIGE